MDILIATRNKGKVTEFSEYFKYKNINIHDLNSLSIDSIPEEPYDSFLMNSFHKARYYSQFTEMLILSDDSGLQVDCLNDAPGVYSARYGGENLSDHERNNYLISNLPEKEVKPRAKFKCLLTLYIRDQWVSFFNGECEGYLIRTQKGFNGHGYDPMFYIEKYSKTLGELDISVKNKISHRAKALAKLIKFIDANYSS
ncbi:MAG: non-canonical purine NTP pyrophosphatase [Dehalococcoidia bacterium]|tara:strand:+ start:142 stop:735 length:594 start_codon:yes stop_codon:yes gene_type:complete